MNTQVKGGWTPDGPSVPQEAARAEIRSSTGNRDPQRRSRQAQLLPSVSEAHRIAELQALFDQERALSNERLLTCLQVEQALEAKRAAVERLSHDLRTPLAAIVAWVAVLQKGKVEAGLLRDGLAVIERSARRQADLLDCFRERGEQAMPTLPTEAPPVADRVPTAQARRLDGVKLLLVDDEADVRDALARMLRAAGAVVFAAGDASEAMTLLRLERPQLMLCDVEMPACDGYQLLRRIRRLSVAAGGLIPAVALSGLDTEGATTRSLDCGFQLHMHKGVRSEALLQVLEQLAAAQVQNNI